ncbi:MAG: hypothetical protein K1W30_07860 [Lachnospiraceae bacterium]
MMVENVSEKRCANIFAHDDEELSEVFTSLWIDIINKKEAESQIKIVNADVLDL